MMLTNDLTSDHKNTVQATVVAIDGRGVIFLGRPGVGKSDLALRLIDDGASLIADDFVHVIERAPWLLACASPRFRSTLFVSGIGAVPVDRHLPDARLCLAVHCVDSGTFSRTPDLSRWRWRDTALPQIALPALAASTPAKLRLALNRWGL